MPPPTSESDINTVTRDHSQADRAPVQAGRLRVGDIVACDYEPVQWFGDTLASHQYGVTRYLKTPNGPQAAYVGPPVTGHLSHVIAALTIGEAPQTAVDDLALVDPVVDSLYASLAAGQTILVLQPEGTTAVHVAVKGSSHPVALIGQASAHAAALAALADHLPGSAILDVYARPGLDDNSRQVLSAIIVTAADNE